VAAINNKGKDQTPRHSSKMTQRQTKYDYEPSAPPTQTQFS